VLSAVVAGIWLLPIAYVFTRWLDAFDYRLPSWTAWPAFVVFTASLLVRWAGQSALGRAWSPTVETTDGHRLVTAGIYARIRHPIYASLLLWAIAQPLLLQNILAGWGGAVAVALIWLVRVPAEEKMMLERFGGDYVTYMRHTGRFIPRSRD